MDTLFRRSKSLLEIKYGWCRCFGQVTIFLDEIKQDHRVEIIPIGICFSPKKTISGIIPTLISAAMSFPRSEALSVMIFNMHNFSALKNLFLFRLWSKYARFYLSKSVTLFAQRGTHRRATPLMFYATWRFVAPLDEIALPKGKHPSGTILGAG